MDRTEGTFESSKLFPILLRETISSLKSPVAPDIK